MGGTTETLRDGFPGPRLAGICMVLAPALLLAGALLLFPFEATTLAERQHEYRTQTTRALIGLEVFVLGWFLSIINVAALATLAARRSPKLARAAGAWALLGVTVSLFFGGIATYEVAQSKIADLAVVTELEKAAEPPLVILLGGSGIVFGWILLAYASYRAEVLPLYRAIALAMTGLLPLTVLGGFPVTMPIPFIGMGIGLIPLGIALLRAPSGPSGQARPTPPAPERRKLGS